MSDIETATKVISSFCKTYEENPEKKPDTTSTRTFLPVPLPTPTTSTSTSEETKSATATATSAKGSLTLTTTGTVKSTSTGTSTGVVVPTKSSGAIARKEMVIGFDGAVGGVGAVMFLLGAFAV